MNKAICGVVMAMLCITANMAGAGNSEMDAPKKGESGQTVSPGQKTVPPKAGPSKAPPASDGKKTPAKADKPV